MNIWKATPSPPMDARTSRQGTDSVSEGRFVCCSSTMLRLRIILLGLTVTIRRMILRTRGRLRVVARPRASSRRIGYTHSSPTTMGKPVGWHNAASRYGYPGIRWLMRPSKGLFCGTYWLGVLRFKVILVGLSHLGASRVPGTRSMSLEHPVLGCRCRTCWSLMVRW